MWAHGSHTWIMDAPGARNVHGRNKDQILSRALHPLFFLNLTQKLPLHRP